MAKNTVVSTALSLTRACLELINENSTAEDRVEIDGLKEVIRQQAAYANEVVDSFAMRTILTIFEGYIRNVNAVPPVHISAETITVPEERN